MDLKQIIILALCLVPVTAWTCMHRCCNQTELTEAATKKLHRQVLQPLEPLLGSRIDASCPLDLYRGTEINDRSLSPWRYVSVTEKDLFPSTYIKAECLCSGCIVEKNGILVESIDYISVPVNQSRMFLKREQGNCKKGMYRLTTFQVNIPVGCTCIRPKYTSED